MPASAGAVNAVLADPPLVEAASLVPSVVFTDPRVVVVLLSELTIGVVGAEKLVKAVRVEETATSERADNVLGVPRIWTTNCASVLLTSLTKLSAPLTVTTIEVGAAENAFG